MMTLPAFPECTIMRFYRSAQKHKMLTSVFGRPAAHDTKTDCPDAEQCESARLRDGTDNRNYGGLLRIIRHVVVPLGFTSMMKANPSVVFVVRIGIVAATSEIMLN
jgi:hypothetical protein